MDASSTMLPAPTRISPLRSLAGLKAIRLRMLPACGQTCDDGGGVDPPPAGGSLGGGGVCVGPGAAAPVPAPVPPPVPALGGLRRDAMAPPPPGTPID